MMQSTLTQLKKKIETSTLKEESKTELLSLLSRLENELRDLADLDLEHAESIAGFAQASTHEAMRKEKVPPLNQLSVEGLRASVAGFENSHPRLVEVVNSICVTLANLGI